MHTQVLQRHRLGSATISLLVVGALLVLAPPSLRSPARPSGESASGKYGQPPLRFEQNVGQEDGRVRYIARTSSYTAFFTDDHVTWSIHDGERTAAITMHPTGGNAHPRITRGDRLAGVSNYLRGSDATKWVRGAKSYASIRYEDVWDGIDVVFRSGSSNSVEYDVIVAPGAPPAAARFSIAGARDLSVRDGELVMDTPAGPLTQRAPRAFQVIDGTRHDVAVRFVIRNGELAFDVGRYDAAREMVIDPEVFSYSTYLGGAQSDSGNAVTIDGNGFAYIAGNSASIAFPVCTGVGTPAACTGPGFDTTPSGVDVYVTKLSADGSQLIYSTFFGGGNEDFPDGIAIDGSGNAYLAGGTNSPDFPVCTGSNTPTTGCAGASFQTAKTSGNPDDAADYDGFVTKLSANGSQLVYSTFLGGADGYDEALDVAVDGTGNAYVAGTSFSSGFPVCTAPGTPTGCVAQAFDTSKGGDEFESDGFVAKLNPTGSGLVYSTYLGGSNDETADGVAVNAAGNAFLTGDTSSFDFPVCTGIAVPSADCIAPSRQTTIGGGPDAFVTKLSVAGTGLLYSTFHGGSTTDSGSSVAVDADGNAFVGGATVSSNFPVCIGSGSPSGCAAAAFDTTKAPPVDNSNSNDGFVSKFNATGTGIAYSTYLGGLGTDNVTDIAIDASGRAYVTGITQSDFPVCTAQNVPIGCSGAGVQTSHGGANFDVFATSLNATGSALRYSTYLGGPNNDTPGGIAVDALGGAAYVAGQTGAGFPVCTAPGTPLGCAGPAFDPSHNGSGDAFVTKLVIAEFRPDALIKKSTGSTFIGDGIYRSDGAGQTVVGRVRRGKSVTFNLEFQNDGAGPTVDAYNVHGCASSKGYKVKYFDANGSDRTAEVKAPFGPTGYSTGNMDPGETHSLTVRIKATQNARGTIRCAVTVTSEEDPTFFDTVRADAKVRG